MKKIVLVLAVFALAATAAHLFSSRQSESQAASAPPEAPPPEVGVITLQPEEVTITQELNGRVVPYTIADVRPQVNGIILERLFKEGADVTVGMQLYQIDPAMYDAQLNSAQAGMAKALANVAVADAKLARYKRLIESKAISQQEYDEVEAASKQAEAEVGIADAMVRIAKINVNYAKVLSPISGRIGKSNVTMGALVTASQANPLAVVQQLDPIYVDVNQPISWMMTLKDDMQAGILQNTGESYAEMRVVLDNGQIYTAKGKLLFADVTVDQTTGTVSLRAEFPNPQHILLPGMYVTALLDIAQKNDAITVPQRALIRDHDGSAHVLTVDGNGAVTKLPVTPVRAIGDKWLIGEGLKGGETVIVDGGQRVRFMPGAPAPKVKAMPAPAGTNGHNSGSNSKSKQG